MNPCPLSMWLVFVMRIHEHFFNMTKSSFVIVLLTFEDEPEPEYFSNSA